MERRKTKLRRRWERTGAAFATPSTLGIALFFLLPLGISLYYAFSQNGSFGLASFARVLGSSTFRLAFLNTWRLFALCITALLLFALVQALLLNYLKKTNPKLVFWLLAIQLLPIAVPSSVTSLFITQCFEAKGIVNGVLVALGWEPVNFLSSDRSFWILTGLYLWKNTGLAVLLFYARIGAIPREFTEAAAIDGAGVWRRTTRIVLPLLQSALFFVCVIGIWGVFKVARESYLIFGNYPASAVYGLQNFLNNHFESANYAALSAASMVFLLAISLLIVIPVVLERRRV